MIKSYLGLGFYLICGLVFADFDNTNSSKGLEKLFSEKRPDIPVKQISPTAVPGIHAIEIEGGVIWHGTSDGRYLFVGDMYAIEEHGFLNISEGLRMNERAEILNKIRPEDMIIFSPTGATRAYMTVFTDVDCGYCQKLHLLVPELNQLGVEVRYLAFPRSGIGSESYRKIVSAWCAENPNEAITKLKARKLIPDLICENPVRDQFELGQRIGISGTPAIILTDGTLLPGYLPVKDLVKNLGI